MKIELGPLNYHHLRLFWAVAHEGNLTRASRRLGLTPQTVSSQVRDLEASLGETLFQRVGRRMVLTEVGRIVLGYADDIFTTGNELLETLRGQPTGRPLRLVVGVANVLPKLMVFHLLDPALHLPQSVSVSCHQGTTAQLLGELALHRLDMILSDSPIPPGTNVRAYNHQLGECGVTFMAAQSLAARLARGFPASLDRVPVLLPTSDAVLRRGLDQWFVAKGVKPIVVGEFEDSGLMKSFGRSSSAFFPVPTVVEREVAQQYDVRAIGRTTEVTERFYAISVERRVRHPAVAAIYQTAKSELFV